MKKTSIVALVTDFGVKDNFVGVMKGVISGINPRAQVIDITHEICRYSVRQAAFILWQSFKYFPYETVFLGIVDPGVGSLRLPIAIKSKHYFFVGPDNGILSMAAQSDGINNAVVLQKEKYFCKNISHTFHGRDIFAPVAAYLAGGLPLSKLGKYIDDIQEMPFPLPSVNARTLEGKIVYIDRFGNLITNIKKDILEKFLQGEKFIAHLNGKPIKRINLFYEQENSKEPFFVVGSFSFLEVCLNQKSAKDYFSIDSTKDYKIKINRIAI